MNTKIHLISSELLLLIILYFSSVTTLHAQSRLENLNLNKISLNEKALNDTSGFGEYTPNKGFKIANTSMGDLNFKIFSYIRYINQTWLDSTYTNAFGRTTPIDKRQDIQLNKVNITFTGWLLDPKLLYMFYVWTNNTAQGQANQVVVAGNVNYSFNKYITLGAGISSLPGTRSLEGNFPFWLPVDNRLITDEFFRPSYTTGLWARGSFDKFQYNAMIGNNLSQLGIDAGQLDNSINTISTSLAWFPTTGEFGLNSNFGDFEDHQKVATRLGAHYTFSQEDRESQPDNDGFENVQIRFSDGTIIFTRNLFGQDISINNLTYHSSNIDAGIKYKGFSLDGAFYYRLLNEFGGTGIDSLPFDNRKDQGYLILASAMLLQKTLQLYSSYSKVIGQYGNPYGIRGGLNWYPWNNYVARFNLEYIYLRKSPVGGLSLPYLVGSDGSMFHLDFLLNF